MHRLRFDPSPAGPTVGTRAEAIHSGVIRGRAIGGKILETLLETLLERAAWQTSR